MALSWLGAGSWQDQLSDGRSRRTGWLFRRFAPVVLGVLGLGLLAPRIGAAELPLQAAARSILGSSQGVFAQAEDGTVLVAQHADRSVHPASVTKVATTTALLQRLGPDYRFETTLIATGDIRNGTLQGNLRVEAGRDPFLVSENAFLMLLELHTLGVRRLDGAVEIQGPWLFNWQEDPGGRRFQRILAGRGGIAAWSAVQATHPEMAMVVLKDIALKFGRGRASNGSGDGAPLLVHRSAPLRRIVKELNCYSNNIFHPLADQIGGPRAVERIARASVPAEIRSAIVIDNAAGGGRTNRLSPRAAVLLVEALQQELHRHGLSPVDVLPVAGVDRGTLRDRLTRPAHRGAVVGKTGTYGSLGISSLAGVARTRRYGEVTFAILNTGLSTPEARRRQDAFLEAVFQAAGPLPWGYEPPVRPPFTEARIDVIR